MSRIKQKRLEKNLSTRVLPQQIVLYPVVILNGKQYMKMNAAQFKKFITYKANLSLQHNGKVLRGSPTICTLPANNLKVTKLQKRMKLDNMHSASKIKDEVVIVDDEDDDSFKEVKREDFGPPEIRKHVHNAVVDHYDEVIQKSSEQSVIKPYSTLWKTNLACDHYPVCKTVFKSFFEKKMHMYEHKYSGTLTFKCSICDMIFSNAIVRNKHVESHTVANTFECNVCLTKFPYYTSYAKHLHDKNCIQEHSIMCSFCGLHFPHVVELQDHREANTKTCVCETSFCDDEAFDMHRDTCLQYYRELNEDSDKKTLKIMHVE